MNERTARCACGELQVALAGDPAWVIVCHCLECQRRTGSAFGVGAYYARTNVTPKGEYQTYSRPGSSGKRLDFHFCRACGSTVFWDLELRPDHVGVAVGALGDPSFAVPGRSVWEATKHPWVEFGCNVDRYTRQST